MKKGLNYNHAMHVSLRTINITPALYLTFGNAKEEVCAHSALLHVGALCREQDFYFSHKIETNIFC